MGLEALPAQWHLLSARPRSVFPGDVGLDGSRNLFTRRLSDASESASAGSSRRSPRRTAPPRASVDGVAPTPGFPSRGPWNEKGVKGGPSSSSLRSECPWPGQGFPEQGGPSGLLRWRSEIPGWMRRASRFDECWGDKWRRANDEICEAERYQGFERLDVNVMNPGLHEVLEGGRASVRGESVRQESDESGRSGASAVEVTAPSFVREASFAERKEQPHDTMVNRVNFSFADRLTDGGGSVMRPPSLKRKPARLFNSGGEERGQGSDRAGKMPIPTPIGLGGRVVTTSIPDSLRNLRKRNERGVAGQGVCAIKNAFDSMVSMVRTLQSYTLQMRKVFVADIDVQQLLSMVHREMHSSFLWLFQQVFSCTPTLMVSMMILFVNFTVFSLGNNVALGVVAPPDPPTSLVSVLQTRVDSDGPAVLTSFDGKSYISFGRRDKLLDQSNFGLPISSEQGYGNHGSGGTGGRSVIVAGGEDGDHITRGASEWNAMFSERDSSLLDLHSVKGFRPTSNLGSVFPPKLLDTMSDNDMGTQRIWTPRENQEVRKTSQQLSYQSLREQIARALELKPGEPYRHVEVDQEALRILVAPVSTKMESDDYLCFDRTDLEYQQAIRAEPSNPMLLANYAQFLYAVRHDYGRAERFFRRALNADADDGDIWTRWASFLWLALKDRTRADQAYRDAIALDPSNPFHVGSYAHFLWHVEDDDSSCCHIPGPAF